MPFNLPILLTWLRILAIPLLVGAFYVPATWLSPQERNIAATAIFIAAALTDWADGYLARKLNQTSAFGAFLDPVADKLMVATALIMLAQLGRVDAVVAAVIIGREIAISALREWMAKLGAAKSVAVSLLGKIKTISQMVAVPMLLFHAPFLGINIQLLGSWLIWAAAGLTLWSMAYYLRMAWPEISRRSGDSS